MCGRVKLGLVLWHTTDFNVFFIISSYVVPTIAESCNALRLIVPELRKHVTETQALTGYVKDNVLLIARIIFASSDIELPCFIEKAVFD